MSALELITIVLVIVGKSKSFYDEISKAIEVAQNNLKAKRKTEPYKPRVKKRQSENVGSEGNPEKQDRIKRNKFCLLMGYSGKNYFGMQRLQLKESIEEELLLAMRKHKWITEQAFKQPRMVEFKRAARTDKGVSAARQCVSLELRKIIFMLLDLAKIKTFYQDTALYTIKTKFFFFRLYLQL